MVRWLNHSRIYNVALINLSRYFYEHHYNIARYLTVTTIYRGELYQLQSNFIQTS